MRLFDKDPDELAGASLIGFEKYVPDQKDAEIRAAYEQYRAVAAIRPTVRRAGHLAWGTIDDCHGCVAEVTMTVERVPSKRRPETMCRLALFEGSHKEPKSATTVFLNGDWESPVEAPEFRKELSKWLRFKVVGALDYESPLPR